MVLLNAYIYIKNGCWSFCNIDIKYWTGFNKNYINRFLETWSQVSVFITLFLVSTSTYSTLGEDKSTRTGLHCC